MGTLFRIVWYGEGDATAAFRRIAELDARLSDYKPESELNRLCRSGGGEVSSDLLTVIEAAQKLARESNGAFDITQGPVIRLWREARKSGKLPAPAALMDAADRGGYQNLEIEGRKVRLLVPGMQLDLGGIAKGFAADEALKILKQQGNASALVAASGDLAIGDAPPGKAGWSVGIDSFRAKPGEFTRVLELKNCAVSTSGDTEQFAVIEGARYSHIINPHTHRPLTVRIGVTVVAGSGLESDPLSTALSVLGPSRGLDLLARSYPKAHALFVGEDGERGSVP
jgi:thiamine biosynthesis lipoprotein